jgi:hypothetical protein
VTECGVTYTKRAWGVWGCPPGRTPIRREHSGPIYKVMRLHSFPAYIEGPSEASPGGLGVPPRKNTHRRRTGRYKLRGFTRCPRTYEGPSEASPGGLGGTPQEDDPADRSATSYEASPVSRVHTKARAKRARGVWGVTPQEEDPTERSGCEAE